MTLINHPGSWQQMTLACLDAGIARDITLMPADVRAVLDGLAAGEAPVAARQAAAILEDTGSPYTLGGPVGAVSETADMLDRAIDAALAGIPDRIPGS